MRFSLLSPSVHGRRWLFPSNFLLKLLLIALLPASAESPRIGEARRLYVSFSDAVLYMYAVAPDLLGSQDEWFPSEMDAEKERRALAFNLCILVIANVRGGTTSCNMMMRRGGVM